MQKNNNITETKSSRIVIILINSFFVCLILMVSFSLEKTLFFSNTFYRHGDISAINIYAPFDYSFADADGKKIDIKKNELIIARGNRINKTQEIALSELKKFESSPKKISYSFGILLLFTLFTIIIVTFFNIYPATKVLFGGKTVLLLSSLIFFIVVVTRFMIDSFWPLLLIPLSSVSMLMAILIEPGIALIFSLILSVFIGVLTGVRFDIAVIMLAGSITSIYAVLNVRKRGDISKAGFLTGLTNMVAVVGIGLINFIPFTDLIIPAAWGLLNGIICAIIVTGSLPIFEILFQITTNISLLELSDLNQPLLKELVLKAPGTYHHSLVVGNLAESAAESIGANSLLSRVGAYFHDIGKARMANYFSENQFPAENKHDNLSPTISSLVIMNHIKEGVDLAKKYRLGRRIAEIIEQHHGTDIVYYFYHRALEEVSEKNQKVEMEDFRYPGPKPQSKEAAIVMLADSVEAASRTLQQPSPSKIEELVKRIINNKFIDGQLDECSLTLKDLQKIFNVFTHILNGIMHTRIEYPNGKQNEQNKDKEPAEENKDKSIPLDTNS